MNDSSSAEIYRQYLLQRCPYLSPQEFTNSFNGLLSQLADTDFSDPETATELNNFGVIALIEAEQADELSLKELYFETAFDAFLTGTELGDYVLCKAHLAIIQKMLGDRDSSAQSAYEGLIHTFTQFNLSSTDLPLGLVYLPPKTGLSLFESTEILQIIHSSSNGLEQATLALAVTLADANLAFYSASGLRTLQLMVHLMPQCSIAKVRLGIASLHQNQAEGLHYLQQAYRLNPKQISIIHILFLACLDLGDSKATNYWLTVARSLAATTDVKGLEWEWLDRLSMSPSTTYVAFDNILLAVEASLNSMVTSTILAQGDWFEDEIVFWRHQLRPGMVVIDVGANVGIYTFSAAKQVGSRGKVFAIEPFSTCVHHLNETRQINQFDWVHICPGAASNHSGKARLGISESNELNQIIPDNTKATIPSEEVQCFTLDELVTVERLTRVDWLKIDAEGHEVQVLEGSFALINQFKPGILYENVAGVGESNLSVANLLIEKGYILHVYHPYFNQLCPLQSLEELSGKLNIVAVHPTHYEQVSVFKR